MSLISQTSNSTTAFLAQTRQPHIYAATIIPFMLSVCFVATRLWYRWKKGDRLQWDDALIVAALISLTGLSVDTLWMLQNSFGRHIQTGGPNVVHNFFFGWFIGEVAYTGVIVFVKFSIVALHWRVFGPRHRRRWMVIMAVIVFLWGASVYIVMFQTCVPLRKYWDPDVPGVCKVDNQAYFIAISIPNILIDIALLAHPVRYIIKLEMDKRRTQFIVCFFLLGGFVCIASILRLVSVVISDLSSPDVTWVYVGQCIWAIVECNAAVICGCLPCLGPQFTALWPSAFNERREFFGIETAEVPGHETIVNVAPPGSAGSREV